MAVLNKGHDFSDGDQVTAAKLDNAVDSATFAAGAVDNASTQLSGGAIIVKDSGITAAKIAANAVTTDKILDANVTTAKIADANVTTTKILDANVTTAKIADANVTKAKIENVADMKVLGNTSGTPAAPAEVSVLDEDDLVSDSATALATQQSIKAYVDALGSYSPSSYTGGESVTFPNGMIMKFGRISKTSNGNHAVTFGTAFPNGIISVSAIENVSAAEAISCSIVGAPSTTSMTIAIADAGGLIGIYWQAFGY